MSEERNSQSEIVAPRDEGAEIDLLDIAIVLAKDKKLLFGVPFAAAVVTALITLLLPNIYTGKAAILPPQQQTSSIAAAVVGQLGVPQGGAILGLKAPGDVYVGMLKSQAIANKLIKRFDLQKRYDRETLVATRKKLEDRSKIEISKEGLLVIEVDDENPKRAAEMANAYVHELDQLTQTLAITEAAQRRLFFEQQLKKARADLANAEDEMQKTQEKTGIIRLEDQGKAIIEAMALLRAQISAKEVQLTAMRSFATERNPEYIRTQQELAGLRAELVKMEKTNVAGQGDIFVPTGKVPEAGLEYVRKFRDVRYFETMFELLAKQYELARIDEAKNAPVVQPVDVATPPDMKSKPSRALIVLLVAFGVGFLTMLWILIRQTYARPAQAPRVELLRQLVRIRRKGGGDV